MSLDPYAYDRLLFDASATLGRARALLQEDPHAAPPRPLAGHERATRRDALLDLEELAAKRPDEPLWTAALPWVRALVLSRATFIDDRREAITRRSVRHFVESPVRGETTLRDALHAVLQTRELVLARAWADTALVIGGEAQALAFLRQRRRAEAAQIAGVTDLHALDVPTVSEEVTTRAALGVLSITEDLVPRRASWAEGVRAALGGEGQEGWPAKLHPRWLAQSLPPDALAGLRLDPPTLPEMLGVASIARALAATGAAFASADRPPGMPRCVARAPSDLLVVRRAALCGALVADATFVARATGMGRSSARDQAGRAARTLVLGLRLDAGMTLLRAVAPEQGRLAALGAEGLSRALGAPVPGPLVGVLPRLDPGCGGEGRPSTAAHLVGAILAAADRERLVDALDEDWFRSPHAADVLRQEHHAHRAAARATAEDVDAGLEAMRRALSAVT